MTSFGISAPGKVILFGEHAVVYGHTAVAASLDLRTRLSFTELMPEIDHENYLYLDMPKISLSCKVPVKQINNYFINSNCPNLKVDGHQDVYRYIKSFVESLEITSHKQRISLECLFLSLLQSLQESELEIRPFRLHVDTALTISSGLGSSASFAVCLSACFLYWSQLQKSSENDVHMKLHFDDDELSMISKNAFNCEMIIHGKPSGIDNSICTRGSFIEFQKNQINSISNPSKVGNIKVILVNTNVDRSTKVLVERLAQLKTKYDTVLKPILESMNEISKAAARILSTEDNSSESEVYSELMVLIEINQGLLSACQLSHSSLDKICAIAKNHNLRAKLTGAGGGGYAYILLSPDTSIETIESLSTDLTESGFSLTQTTLGGEGVKIYRHSHQD